MINVVKDLKSLPRHSIYMMYFKWVELTSTDRYFLRKKDLDRCQVPGQGAKPLEAECVSINQFIFELKIQFISLFPLYPLQVSQKLDIRKL